MKKGQDVGELKAIWRKPQWEVGRGPQKHGMRDGKNKAARGNSTIEYSSGPEKTPPTAHADLLYSKAGPTIDDGERGKTI